MFGTIWHYLKETGSDFWDDNALSRGAAISFYTILSLGPLLVLCIAVAGVFFGEDAAQGAIVDQLRGMMGQQSAEMIQSMIASAGKHNGGFWATMIGVGTLLITATSVFAELQAALNFIWKAEPQAGIGPVIKARAAGLGLVASLGFLLLVSLVISAALQAVSSYVLGVVPAAKAMFEVANVLVTFFIISALFAAIYRILPDRQISWGDVVVGAVVTAFLSTIGKIAIAWYIATFSVANSYGAAGTLIVVLIWIYYSCEIFLLGAEFTKVWAAHHGSREAFEARELTGAGGVPQKVVVQQSRRIGLFDIAALGTIALAMRAGSRQSRWF
jgi:membrane protein